MDPHYSAQDVARCDLCKTAIAQSYCDFCHVNLCKPCIGEHISDDYSKHTIVPFELRRSTPIYPKCENHPNKICDLQCKDCNIYLCSYCLASKQHNKYHELSRLEEIFNQKKDQIKKDREEIKLQLLPAYEDIATELENKIASLDVAYNKLTMEMSKHREELHREIDKAINQRQKEIDENKANHLSILKKHLKEIKQLQSLMQETLHNLNEKEDSNEVTPTISYSSKNQFSKLPPKVNVSMPKFIPQQIKKEDLCRLIGKLTPLSTTLEERVFTAKKPNISHKELFDEPEVLNTIKTGHGQLDSVTCLNEEEIWTSGERTADIKCFNTRGVLQKTIKTKPGSCPRDIAVYSDGALVYSGGWTRTVYKVTNGQIEEIIWLQGWRPTELCVTSSGDLLVTMFSDNKTQSKVVRFSGSTEKQTIQFDNDGQPLYSGNTYPKYITENRNLDICVADCGAGAVVVVNQAGKLRFRYTGQSSSTKSKPFKPTGITTDSQSRILTSDNFNHCIHILDVDGRFLQYIDSCDLEDPAGLCVDSDDNLFVCEFSRGNVKKIKYLK
uniref:Uncharacterized protein LOC111100977 isoform X3 n=1 Tax=Crassostrea virginica TaxID=6565 RepID=A0A8B8ABL6_CRAVI|nr:uncharacterized protein LOC111100977 isoform X3 [Crassostrea virginica]